MVDGHNVTQIEDTTHYVKGEDQQLSQIDPEVGDEDDNAAIETTLNNDDRSDKGEEVQDGDQVDTPWKGRFLDVVKTFAPLGWVAFGGPQAHVALLREQLVEQRKWMDEDQFTELFAIGQGLPGPTGTQLVVSTSLARAGPLGGLVAFFFWILPGLILLTTFGTLLDSYIDPDDPPFWLVGLPPAAVALVFKAMYGFSRNLDSLEMTLTLIAGLLAVLISGGDEKIPNSSSQYAFPLSLVFGGMVTYIDSKRSNPWSKYPPPSQGWQAESDRTLSRIGIPLWVGGMIFGLWLFLLILVICLVQVAGIKNVYLEIFELMFRIGSIIFGGGQVVLPLLQDEVVPKWMTKQQFLQGLGLAQSMPGPLFNFSAYLGAVYQGIPGALVGFLGIFGPGIILIFAAVPFWARLRHVPWFRSTLKGVNAAAIGLVGAACILLWEAAVSTTADALVFSLAGYCAVVWNLQAPLAIISGGILGAILHKDALNLGQVNFCSEQG